MSRSIGGGEDAQEVVTVDPAGGDHHGAADEVEDGEGRRKIRPQTKNLQELELEGEVMLASRLYSRFICRCVFAWGARTRRKMSTSRC